MHPFAFALTFLIAVCAIGIGNAQTTLPFTGASISSGGGGALIPAANDVTLNWQAAGLQPIGGIPSGRTICATITPTGVTPPTGADDAVAIANAIAACPTGQKLVLNGNFVLDLTESVFINKAITVAGAGTCLLTGSNIAQTCSSSIIHRNGALPVYNGSVCGVNTGSIVTCTTSQSIVYISPTGTFDYGWGVSGKACGHDNPCNVGIPLTADANKGDTTIFLSSTTGLSAGMWVRIDEQSQSISQTDPISSLGQTWAGYDFQTASTTPVTGRVVWGKHNPSFATDNFGSNFNSGSGGDFPFNTTGGVACSYGINCDRPTAEWHLITSVNAGVSITVDTPMTVNYRVLGGGVQFQGYISTGCGSTTAGKVLCVTSVTAGGNNLAANQPLWWNAQTAAAAIWYITSTGTGSGGTGTYNVSNGQNGGASSNLSLGSAASPVTFYANAGNAQILLPQSQSGVATTLLAQAGLENISIGRGVEGAVSVNQCAYCWVKGVDAFGWVNGGINVGNSPRFEARGNYIHDGYDLQNNGVEYAIAMNDSTTECLIIDNAVTFAGKSMVARGGVTGCVIAYNYLDKTMYQGTVIGNYWQDHAANCSHFLGPHHCLFEGNWTPTLGDDDTHGNSMYMTYYRNWSTATRTNFNDPSFTTSTSATFNPTNAPNSDASKIGFATGQSYPYSGGTGPRRGFGTQPWNYFAAVVANVLGLSGNTTSGNGFVQFNSFAGGSYGGMYLLGWNSVSPYVSDPNLTPGVAPWIFINGNYGYLNNSIVWQSSPVTLQNSLFASVAPYVLTGTSCTYPWPWVDPTSGTQIKVPTGSGCSTVSGLPAKARYDAGLPLGANP